MLSFLRALGTICLAGTVKKCLQRWLLARKWYLLFAAYLVLASGQAFASDCYNNAAASQTDCGEVIMLLNSSSQAVPVTPTAPLPVIPSSPTAINVTATGTTGAVSAVLLGVAGKTTYICGFNVQAIGGTAAVGPITIGNLIGSAQIYQGSSSAAGGTVASANFSPCIPAAAQNLGISVTTTADGTATAVDVNTWGYQQ